MTMICVVVSLVLLGVIVAGITRGLRRVNQKIYDLVHSKGDLTQKIEITTGDEMELIAGNVNGLLEYISGIMLSISGNSRQLDSSSQNVLQDISGVEMNITDVSATMEEMSAPWRRQVHLFTILMSRSERYTDRWTQFQRMRIQEKVLQMKLWKRRQEFMKER